MAADVLSAFMFLALASPAPIGEAPPETDQSGQDPQSSIAALPLDIEGDLPEQWRETAGQRLLEGIDRGGMDVVGPGTLDVKSCAEPSCFQEVAAETGTAYVLQSRLWVEAEQRDYRLELRVYSGTSGKQVASLEGSCELCGFEEAVDLVAAKAAAIPGALRKLQLGNALFTFTSNPAGAGLEIDGLPVGDTPVRQTLTPGTHRVRATMPGFLPQTFEVESVEGVNKELQFQLVPASTAGRADTVASGPDGRGMIIGGAVLTGAGIAAVGAGAALLAIDGRPDRSNCEADASGNCRFLYGTQTAGIVSLAVGIASVGAGVALLIVGKRRQQRERRRVGVRIGPGSMSLRF